MALIRKEYDVGHALKHPRLIQVLEFGRHKGQPYVLLELFSAPNLKILLQQQGSEQLAPLAVKFVEQSSEALAYFNGEGWVHRDIKPDNFLMSETGEVKMIDFALGQKPKTGLAKLFAGKTKVQGTPSYMSPEQIRGEPLDIKADIYSYGCTLYELFTGKRPFTGMSTNELLNRHLRGGAFHRDTQPQRNPGVCGPGARHDGQEARGPARHRTIPP